MPHNNRMKISNLDYDILKEAIIHAKPRLDQFNQGLTILRANSETQFRWEVYHIANAQSRYAISKRLYEYMNDEQIDTALRSIIDDIEQLIHYHLTIKGNQPDEIANHATDFKIVSQSFNEMSNWLHVTIQTEFNQTINLNNWFTRSITPPFPEGELLLWSECRPFVFGRMGTNVKA